MLKWIGAAYILFLAYTVVRDKPKEKNGAQRLNPSGFLTGMVMQFVNPKAILYGITAFTAFILPHIESVALLAACVVLLAFAAFAGTTCWAAFGSVFQRVFREHRRVLNAVMALLLVYCAVASVL